MALDLAVDEAVALPAVLKKRLAAAVARMVKAAAKHDGRKDYEVGLRLTTDAEIRVLNRDYRSKNKPTDVLAFAQREGPAGGLHPELLGDIVISVDTARRQAKKGLAAELLHLASHGLCHLLGYDHRDDAEERVMNARAAALRKESARSGRVSAA
ncbi:MAG: rRNA maturation RNase YbeY [Deltaproteobacteria bacterium]|nr:rRNA maturation RNase YbeY [Deltaproteobacteria bacterium]